MVVVICDERKSFLKFLLPGYLSVWQLTRDFSDPDSPDCKLPDRDSPGFHLNPAVWETTAATGLLHSLDAQDSEAFLAASATSERYLRRLLPSLSVSIESGSVKSYSI
jgi:hypothetical protein